MNGLAKTTVLLSLIFPVISFTDYYHHPTPKTRFRERDTANGNRYTSSNRNDTVIRNTQDRNSHQRTTGYDGHIIYPDTDLNASCIHGLCENVVDYPKEKIEKLLSRSAFVSSYFEAKEFVDVPTRFGSDEEALCDTMVRTIYPEKAKNTKEEEKLIVNVEGHKQGIVFETCLNNGPCKFSTTFPSGYTSFCKQKYIHKRLMVLGDNDKFVFDSFEVPSCCVCTVKKT